MLRYSSEWRFDVVKGINPVTVSYNFWSESLIIARFNSTLPLSGDRDRLADWRSFSRRSRYADQPEGFSGDFLTLRKSFARIISAWAFFRSFVDTDWLACARIVCHCGVLAGCCADDDVKAAEDVGTGVMRAPSK